MRSDTMGIWGLAVLTAVLVVPILIESQTFNHGFYDSELKKLHSSDGLLDTSRNLTGSLIWYYQDKTDTLGVTYIEPSEVSHLGDVKNVLRSMILFKRVMAIIWLIAVGFLIYAYRFEYFRVVGAFYEKAGILLTIGVGLLFICSLFFEGAFSAFHKLFFPQGNYSFPADSLLIRIYPQQFFLDFLLHVLFNIIIFAILIFATGKLLVGLHNAKERRKHLPKN